MNTFRNWQAPRAIDALLNVFLTLNSLLRQRGYHIPDENFLPYSSYEEYLVKIEMFTGIINNIKNYYLVNFNRRITDRRALSQVYYIYDSSRSNEPDYPSDQHIIHDLTVYVRFMDTISGSQMTKTNVDVAIEKAIEKKYRNLILISEIGYSTGSYKDVEDFASKINVEFFVDQKLRFNPTTHILNPIQIKLNDEEKKKFLAQGISTSLMPPMKYADPNVTYNKLIIGDDSKRGWTNGDIIKVIRRNVGTNGIVKYSIFYRVIEAK